MKMKTIEEKAKAYDRAIANAKEKAIDGYLDAVAVNDIFPELAESKDEEIRKELIAAFQNGVTYNQISKAKAKDYIAWLEKQGEQNLTNSAKTCKDEQKSAEWSKDDERKLNTVCSLMYSNPAQDPFYAKVSLENWLKSLKDRVQRKQEWSEEDKAILEKCIGAVKVSCYSYSFKSEAENWLKSLRPQSTWRPSDEEMKALEFCLEHNIDKDGVFGSKVVKLYDELNKLREELL